MAQHLKQALALAAICVVLPIEAHAGVGTFTIDGSSTLSSTMTVGVPVTGTLKGNYDATANPTGTQTRPGYFGGSGNVPIPYTAATEIVMSVNSAPDGSYALVQDVIGYSVVGLSMDLLGGTPGTVASTITVNWNSFHTVAPTAIFPGGAPIALPIENGSITSLLAVQNGPAPMTMLETAPGVYTVNAVVPVAMSYVGSVMGTVYKGTGLQAAIALNGTLTVTSAGSTLVADASSSETVPLPAATTGFVDQPLAVPTVIPAGSTANLLMSGLPGAGTASTIITAHLVSTAPAQPNNPADLDNDGVVAGGDLAVMLALWGHVGTAADLDGDGVVAGGDLSIMLGAWGS